MRKCFVLLLLLSLILCSFSSFSVAAAEELTPYELAETFASAFPTRDILSGGEGKAAIALRSYLEDCGYEVSTPSLQYVEENVSGAKVNYDFSPVIGRLSRGKGKTVLIGGLVYTAGLGSQIELRPVFGKGVLADVISESVFELTHLDGRIVRKRLHHGVLC